MLLRYNGLNIAASRHLLVGIFLVLLIVLAPGTSFGFYEKCIKSYEFGGTSSEIVVLAPSNSACQARCDRECGGFSRKTPPCPVGSKTCNSRELNGDIIQNCMFHCQNGEAYESYYYEDIGEDGGPEILLMPKVAIGTYCGGSVTPDRPYKTNFSVKSGDEINIWLTTSDAGPNKVYMCGRKEARIRPIMWSMNKGDWDNNSNLTMWNEQIDHKCLVNLDQSTWDQLTNKKLWVAQNTHECKWSARNYYYTDTGIYIKDGDELSIWWSGDYAYRYSFGPNGDNRKVLMDAIGNKSTPPYLRALAEKQWENISTLHVKPPGISDMNTAQFIPLVGDKARVVPLGDIPDDMSLINDPEKRPAHTKWYGLQGRVNDSNLKTAEIDAPPLCHTKQLRQKNYNICNYVTDPGKSEYFFSGILNGFSSSPALFALRHYEDLQTDETRRRNWYEENNLGGFEVGISWGGCPYENGARMQYAAHDGEGDVPEGNWRDVPSNVTLLGQPLKVEGGGLLYFRIKPVTAPPGVSPEIQELYDNPAHRHGRYLFSITKRKESGARSATGPIRSIIDFVRSTLYGDDDKPGVVERMFINFVKDVRFIQIIRAILVFYVVFLGVGFLLGIVKHTQKELVIRLLKFSFVAIVISENSWEFFSNNFFKLFIDGGIELIALIVGGSLTTDVVVLKEDPSAVFTLFDGPFQMLFSREVWLKIYALSFTSLLGVALAIMVIIAAITYAIAIAKATLMYLASMISISILILVAPIFIPMMLFQLTKQMFDSWWKYLLSYTLQPIMLFSAIAIFNILIIIALYSALSFTICPGCAFLIDIKNFMELCIIPGWELMAVSHFPEDTPPFFLPSTILSGVLIFLMLTHAMYSFCDFIVLLTHRIVTGSPIRFATVADPAGVGFGAMRGAVGIDRSSRVRRKEKAEKKELEKKKEEEKKKKAKGRGAPPPPPGA